MLSAGRNHCTSKPRLSFGTGKCFRYIARHFSLTERGRWLRLWALRRLPKKIAPGLKGCLPCTRSTAGLRFLRCSKETVNALNTWSRALEAPEGDGARLAPGGQLGALSHLPLLSGA